MNLDKVNKYIKEFENTIEKPVLNFDKNEFYVGVDLGTANIVIAILDKNGNPVAGATKRSSSKRRSGCRFCRSYINSKKIKGRIGKD